MKLYFSMLNVRSVSICDKMYVCPVTFASKKQKETENFTTQTDLNGDLIGI